MKEIDKVISEIANARKGLQKVKAKKEAPKKEEASKTLKISAKRLPHHKTKTMEALMPPAAVAL